MTDFLPVLLVDLPDLLTHIIDAPLANILIVAGLAFLAIAVIGKISGKIEPNTASRIMAGILGTVLFVLGIYSHRVTDRERSQQNQATATATTPTSEPNRTNGTSLRQPPDEPKKHLQSTLRTEGQPKTEQATVRSRLLGTWTNDNPQTNGIKKLEIRQDGDAVLIGVWSKQDWGIKEATLTGNSATVVWDQASVIRNMTITPDAGRLQVVVDNRYKDNRPARRTKEYFVKSE